MNNLSAQLKQLKDFDPPPGGWPRLGRELDGRRRQRTLYGSLALAASVLIVLAILPRAAVVAVPAAPDDIARLMAHSRQLEGQLDQVRPQVAAWNAPLARRALDLQNDLTVVDLQLNYAQHDGARRLWQDRVKLMSQLVQTHQQAAQLPDSIDTSKEISL